MAKITIVNEEGQNLNRYLITPADGSTPFTADLSRAADITKQGTPFSDDTMGHYVQTEDLAELDPNDIGAATKSTPTTATLPASGWAGSEAPYSQTVTVAGAKPEPTRIEVQPTTDATAAQWAAWRAALIRGGGQGTDSITLLADGDKPEIDIPIAVTIRGDVS